MLEITGIIRFLIQKNMLVSERDVVERVMGHQ